MNTLPQVAAIQIKNAGSVQERMAQVDALCRQAASHGASLLVLPENFACYGERDFAAAADREQDNQGPVRASLSTLADELNVWIVGGTLPLWQAGHSLEKPYASALVFAPDGSQPYRYNKIHLFEADIAETKRAYRETNYFTPGTGETLVFDTPLGKVGVLICFDLRFPKLALKLVEKGADIIVVPSAFTLETGRDHWQLLLQARALDTQCYIVGANLAGRDHRKPTWGGSAIVDPWGRVVAQMDDEEGFISAAIDLNKLQSIRRNLPLK